MKIPKIVLYASTVLAASSASASSDLTLDANFFFTTGLDADVSVFDGAAKYSGDGPTNVAGSVTGVFGDGTLLDYRLVGVDRTNSNALAEHVNGGGTYLSALSVGTTGSSGGANTSMDYWWDTDPGATFATTPDSEPPLSGIDDVAGGTNIGGTIDISGLSAATVYFLYGSYKNGSTVALTMTGAGQTDLVFDLVSPFDGPANDHLWIGSANIDNSSGLYDQVTWEYTVGVDNNAGRGRFGGVLLDGTLVPEPSTLGFIGLAGLALLIRRRR